LQNFVAGKKHEILPRFFLSAAKNEKSFAQNFVAGKKHEILPRFKLCAIFRICAWFAVT
tara:strand:- start:1015 stop:1191 length:177 start_codon:yes stop_codon:yes gene_type:complete